jgi:hypothetical protein
MKQWPKIGSKIIYRGANKKFWYTSIIENAEKNLEIDKEYTITRLELASSWCAVILEEFPDKQFSLSWFTYEKELTTEEVMQIKKQGWETVRYEFTSLEELKNRKK